MNKKSLIWIVGGVVGLGLIVAMAYAIAGEEPPDPSLAFGDVTVTGTALPQIPQGQVDRSQGQVAATVVGADWEGTRVAIEPNGRPKVVIFLAHWCQFCQAEVPIVQDFVDAGGVPDDVDFISVSILADPNRVEFPPQNWLAREGWTTPIIADNQARSVATAYGAFSTPFWMVLDGNNVNLGRTSGMMSVSDLQQLFALAQSSIPANASG